MPESKNKHDAAIQVAALALKKKQIEAMYEAEGAGKKKHLFTVKGSNAGSKQTFTATVQFKKPPSTLRDDSDTPDEDRSDDGSPHEDQTPNTYTVTVSPESSTSAAFSPATPPLAQSYQFTVTQPITASNGRIVVKSDSAGDIDPETALRLQLMVVFRHLAATAINGKPLSEIHFHQFTGLPAGVTYSDGSTQEEGIVASVNSKPQFTFTSGGKVKAINADQFILETLESFKSEDVSGDLIQSVDSLNVFMPGGKLIKNSYPGVGEEEEEEEYVASSSTAVAATFAAVAATFAVVGATAAAAAVSSLMSGHTSDTDQSVSRNTSSEDYPEDRLGESGNGGTSFKPSDEGDTVQTPVNDSSNRPRNTSVSDVSAHAEDSLSGSGVSTTPRADEIPVSDGDVTTERQNANDFSQLVNLQEPSGDQNVEAWTELFDSVRQVRVNESVRFSSDSPQAINSSLQSLVNLDGRSNSSDMQIFSRLPVARRSSSSRQNFRLLSGEGSLRAFNSGYSLHFSLVPSSPNLSLQPHRGGEAFLGTGDRFNTNSQPFFRTGINRNLVSAARNPNHSIFGDLNFPGTGAGSYQLIHVSVSYQENEHSHNLLCLNVDGQPLSSCIYENTSAVVPTNASQNQFQAGQLALTGGLIEDVASLMLTQSALTKVVYKINTVSFTLQGEGSKIFIENVNQFFGGQDSSNPMTQQALIGGSDGDMLRLLPGNFMSAISDSKDLHALTNTLGVTSGFAGKATFEAFGSQPTNEAKNLTSFAPTESGRSVKLRYVGNSKGLVTTFNNGAMSVWGDMFQNTNDLPSGYFYAPRTSPSFQVDNLINGNAERLLLPLGDYQPYRGSNELLRVQGAQNIEGSCFANPSACAVSPYTPPHSSMAFENSLPLVMMLACFNNLYVFARPLVSPVVLVYVVTLQAITYVNSLLLSQPQSSQFDDSTHTNTRPGPCFFQRSGWEVSNKNTNNFGYFDRSSLHQDITPILQYLRNIDSTSPSALNRKEQLNIIGQLAQHFQKAMFDGVSDDQLYTSIANSKTLNAGNVMLVQKAFSKACDDAKPVSSKPQYFPKMKVTVTATTP